MIWPSLPYRDMTARTTWDAPIASEVILVNTPGVTTSDLSFFDYRNRRRPLYPFEADGVYP